MKKHLLLVIFLVASLITLSQNNKIDRPAFSLEYPASWKIDTEDPDYDPDALFSLDADENNLVMFVIMDQKIDPSIILEAQVESMKENVMSKPGSITDFTEWGSYKGQGKIMKGKLLGVLAGSIKIFTFNHGSQTFLVVIQVLDADMEKLKDGINVVENSFRFKETK